MKMSEKEKGNGAWVFERNRKWYLVAKKKKKKEKRIMAKP